MKAPLGTPPCPPAIPRGTPLSPPPAVPVRHYRARSSSFSVRLTRAGEGVAPLPLAAKVTIRPALDGSYYVTASSPAVPDRREKGLDLRGAKSMAAAAVASLKALGWAVVEVSSYHADPKFSSNSQPCCERATKTYCVCVASWQCPEHGKTCYGSHD